MLRIDLESPIALTLALLAALERCRRPRRVHRVGGGSALAPPSEAVYAASKAGITAFAEGLRVDLGVAGSPVGVHVVQPGVLATDLFELPDNDPSIADIEPLTRRRSSWPPCSRRWRRAPRRRSCRSGSPTSRR